MKVINEVLVNRHQLIGESICKALLSEALKLGFDEQALPLIAWSELEFSVNSDRVDGNECLRGIWKDPSGYRLGQVQFNSDGSFYAEHDIVLGHPKDKRWFVEAIEAWGRDSQIATEARLLTAV